jgi:hypothetical protein
MLRAAFCFTSPAGSVLHLLQHFKRMEPDTNTAIENTAVFSIGKGRITMGKGGDVVQDSSKDKGFTVCEAAPKYLKICSLEDSLEASEFRANDQESELWSVFLVAGILVPCFTVFAPMTVLVPVCIAFTEGIVAVVPFIVACIVSLMLPAFYSAVFKKHYFRGARAPPLRFTHQPRTKWHRRPRTIFATQIMPQRSDLLVAVSVAAFEQRYCLNWCTTQSRSA